VFADLGLEEIETKDGILSLRFLWEKEVPNDGVIEVSVIERSMEQPA
jgi:hypothetical protein